MAYKDLRDWIQRVESFGELKRLEGAHWELEMGAITELAGKKRSKPAILFDRIQGYPPGYRVLVNLLNGMKRVALTVGMSPEMGQLEFVKAWREHEKEMQLIPPVMVREGPVLENIQEGTDINLLKFPTPLWHELDGGRYIGTATVTITRDPDNGWVNLGTYRVMVHDEKSLALYISPGKHGRLHLQKYFERGEPCPVAITFGQDPMLFLAAGIELPYGLCEYEWVGGVKGEPVEVLRGELTSLPIPARAEIAIEGELMPGELRPEGPFGEATGYYGSSVRPEPVVRVKRVMHRKDPIITGQPPFPPPSGAHYYLALFKAAAIWEELEKAGVPDVRGVRCHEFAGTRFLTIVAIKQRYPGHARQAGIIASQCHTGAYKGRYTVVVDEDIDIYDTDELLWAIATRSDPETDIEIMRRCWSSALDPIIPKGRKGFNSRAVIDACRPYEWLADFPPVVKCSPELERSVRAKWDAFLAEE